MADVLEIWATNGAVVERDFTAEESAQRESDIAAAQAAEAEKLQAEAKREAARIAAVAHAKSLGFTDAMIGAMGLAPVENKTEVPEA